MQQLLAAPEDPIKDKWPQSRIFHTNIKCENEVVKLIIDGESCANVVSQALVKKANLKSSIRTVQGCLD